MTLSKPTKSRERILLYGQEGSGKTTAWATLAHHLRACDPMPKVYVLDTDQTVSRTSEGYVDWDRNVVVSDLYGSTWPDFQKASVMYGALGGVDDWLIVDTADTAWDTVQGHFTEQAFGKEIDEWFLAFRRDHPDGKGNALAGSYGSNWGIINKMYSRYIMAVLRFRGHVLMCCPADSMASRQGSDGGTVAGDPEITNLYGRIGWRPRGQKKLGYQCHTVLFMQFDGKDWRATTVKDRERTMVKGMVVKDFVEDYLVGVAGWTN